MDKLTDVAGRAASLSEVLLRTTAMPNLEMLVALCVLYLRATEVAGTARHKDEQLSLMRSAYRRYREAHPEHFTPDTFDEYMLSVGDSVRANRRYN